jgi:urea carboxylase-associated protein 2
LELSPETMAAGTGGTGLSLPPATQLGAEPIAPDAVLTDETIPGGWYTALRMRRGEGLRLVDVEGNGSVAFFAWSAADPSERLNHADTIKVQWTAKLAKGRILFSDMGRALVSIVEDTTGGGHDALSGVSNAASTRATYGTGAYRNGRDNLVLGANKLGLSRRDLAPVISFFAPVSVESAGALRFAAEGKTPGAFVDLRAEMDILVALSFAPHPLDPSPDYAPGPVRVIRHRLPEPSADDACRTATAEAARAFANLNTYLA